MKRNLASRLPALCLLCILFTAHAAANELENGEAATPANGALQAPAEPRNTRHNVIRGTSMCVGGAIVGSVVPLFGTAIGCGLGIAYAWFSAD